MCACLGYKVDNSRICKSLGFGQKFGTPKFKRACDVFGLDKAYEESGLSRLSVSAVVLLLYIYIYIFIYIYKKFL